MWRLEASTSSRRDQAYSFWFRRQRFAGYVLLPDVFSAAEALFSGAGADPGTTRPPAENIRLAASLLRQALVFYPLDLRLLGCVERLQTLAPHPPAFEAWFRALQRLYRACPRHFVDSIALYAQMRSDRTETAITRLLESRNAGLMCVAIHELWSKGLWETIRDTFQKIMTLPEVLFLLPLAAWGAWNAGEKDLAACWLNLSTPESFLTHNLRAEMAVEEGRQEEARRHWRWSLEWEPHQPHLLHRFWESRRPQSADAVGGDRRVHIVFYTYNKLETTLATLRSLLASGIGDSPVTILNNGSTRFCREDLELGVRNVAQGRKVDLIHLPVNIGAPAARNWLWNLPQVKSFDYVAFLDDDVLVPPGWLGLYLDSLELFPHAVVVGPRGLNPGSLPTIQYVHRFFQQVGHHKILFTPPAPMIQDLGQFTYRHPCLSVMGCCHLFDRRRWEALGIPDFDICFAPSQVDDLEHDLQIWKRGGQVVYDGRVAVIHLQDAGRMAPKSQAAWGHVLGNHMKMESKFTGADLEEIKRQVEDADDAFHDRVRSEVGMELLEATLPIENSLQHAV